MTVKAGLQYYPFRIASFAWQQRGGETRVCACWDQLNLRYCSIGGQQGFGWVT